MVFAVIVSKGDEDRNVWEIFSEYLLDFHMSLLKLFIKLVSEWCVLILRVSGKRMSSEVACEEDRVNRLLLVDFIE